MTNERLHRTLAVLEELYYHELNVLKQLSYVIENIQAPIQQSIKSTYDTSERQPFPEIASLHRRVQKLLTSRLLPEENNKVYKKKQKGSKIIHPPASPFRASDKHISAKIGIMSNEQYWTLFANLALLYQSHLEVMEQLHSLLNVLYSACTNLDRSEEYENEVEWEYNVCSFFHSKVMEEFMAQHYMYSVHFTCNAAPLVMQLARLWRWSVRQVQNNNINSDNNNNEKGSSGSSAANSKKEDNSVEIDLQRLCSSDRQKLVCFASFIDFIYRSFGNAGIPRDSRVHDVHLPENRMEMESSLYNKNENNEKNKNESKSHKVSKGVMAHLDYRTHLPRIPPNYVGFYTLLMLLATPLHSLRTLQHTARTLLENKWICSEYGREVIAVHFLSSVHEWMSGANNEINEFTAMDDVHSILSLIDESNMRESCNTISTDKVAQQNSKTRNNTNSVLDSLSLPHHTRILIHYGHLSINRKRIREERLFFLFSDVLCYVEELPNGRLMLQGALSLLHIKVNVVAEVANTELVNCFEVCSTNANKTNTTDSKCLTLCAESAEQRLQWVNAISYATHKLREGQRKVGKPQNENNNNNINKMHGSCILQPKSRLTRQRCQDVEWQRHFHPTEFVERTNTFATIKQTNVTKTTDNINISVNVNIKEQEELSETESKEKVDVEEDNVINQKKNLAQDQKKVTNDSINNFNNKKTTKETHEELEYQYLEEEKPTHTHHEVSSHSHSHSSWSSYITTHRRIRSNEVGTLLLLQPQLSSPSSASLEKDDAIVAEIERKDDNDDDSKTTQQEQSTNNLHHHTRTESKQKMKKEEEEEEESSEESESSITANTKVHGDSSIFTCKVESTEASIGEDENNENDDLIHGNNDKTTIDDGEATYLTHFKSHSHLHEREVNNAIPLSRLLTERFESCVFVHKVNEQADIDEESALEEMEQEQHRKKIDSDNDDKVKNEIQSGSSRESNLHPDINNDNDNQKNYLTSIKQACNKNVDDAPHNDEISESLERQYNV